MKFELVKCTCGACNIQFNAPEVPGSAYGDFLLRSDDSDEMRFLAALTDKIYDEVDELMMKSPRVAALSACARAKILQDIYGPVACDPNGHGNAFKIGLRPRCPSCAAQSISSWAFMEPPEFVELEVRPVTHVLWRSLAPDERTNSVLEQLNSAAA